MTQNIEITSETISYLIQFLENTFPPTFRYFYNKTVSQVIQNHYKTIIILDENIPVAYAHIDYDIANDKHWIGLCVLERAQKKGLGTQLMTIILNYFKQSTFNKLYLSVDKTNTVAINLYTKYGFKIHRSTATIHFMSLTKHQYLYVPVSFGEAIDKLTILHIKMDKIHDERRVYVETEYNTLLHEIKHLILEIPFYYEALKTINLGIWEDQDIFRYTHNQEQQTELCKKIIEDNDARFRIKNKINFYLKSHLKEQKGYIPKTFTINYSNNPKYAKILYSIIKYKSIFFDNVIVFCDSSMITNIKNIFKDDNTILVQNDNTFIEPCEDEIHTLYDNIKSSNYFDFVEGYFSIGK